VGDVDDRKDTSYFVFFFLGDCVISWSSKKQLVITPSSDKAEYVAITSCTCHTIWLTRFIVEGAQFCTN